ncbi:MAG: sensor histidine kinase KdpD [Myxococcota bacterium]
MNEDLARPDPDALLRSVQAAEARRQRGRLKVFFGMAPGVGKTFAMLEAARRAKDAGLDVVVGWVETHGRKETAALVEGLERLPPRVVAHRGRSIEEFDVDAALARKPGLLLVDELAHTNPPTQPDGGLHAKRWQDVLDLVDAGVDIWTTLNVQHVESLNDVIAQITGVRVRETVPDHVLDRADEIELVDLPPDELLVRLGEGKVYFPEQAERAAQNFFKRGNLLALRELALRRTAARVEADVQAYREEHGVHTRWEAGERLLVCVGPDPSSADAVRAARRMAERIPATWIAVHVEASDRAPLSAEARERVNEHLRLAETLGAEVAWLAGPRAAEAIVDHARAHHVTRIVLGQSQRLRRFGQLRRLLGWVAGSLADDLMRKAGDVELLVVPAAARRATHARAGTAQPATAPDRRVADYGWAVLIIALATLLSYFGKHVLEIPDVAMLYVLGVVLVALRFGSGPSLVASALSVACYDFFFVPPTLGFSVTDTRHFLTFATMFGIGAIISTLAGRIRRQTAATRDREARTAALFKLVRDLSVGAEAVEVATTAAQHTSEVFGCDVAVMTRPPEDEDELVVLGASPGMTPLDPSALAVARWVLDHLRPGGIGADALPGAAVACFPLSAGPTVLGVVVLRPRDKASRALLETLEQRHFVDLFTRQTALSLSRARATDDARTAALRARTEELRSSLLSSVSHDLRTPLASITGAATTLRDSALEPDMRGELLQSVIDEASRLERLVTNLLDMTRLQAGGLVPAREWVPVDELVGAATTRLEAALEGRPLTIELAPELPLLHVDPVLLQQVLVNVLENALAYTPAGSPLEITAEHIARGHASAASNRVVIRIADRGPGIPRGDEERIFERFQRGATKRAGAGLGLAICRGIMLAHGGTIRAEQRPGGGAVFVLELPASAVGPKVVEASGAAGEAA